MLKMLQISSLVRYSSFPMVGAVRVDQNIDSPDGFDDVAVQFLERGAVAGDDLFGHATGFLSDSFPGDAGCRRPGTVLYSLMLYKG